jgi:hypothetical protein
LPHYARDSLFSLSCFTSVAGSRDGVKQLFMYRLKGNTGKTACYNEPMKRLLYIPLLLIICGFIVHRAEQQRNAERAKLMKQLDMSSPPATWKSFLWALKNENEAALQILTTPECLTFIKEEAMRGKGGMTVIWSLGRGWSRRKLSWGPTSVDLAHVELVGGQGPNFVLKKTAQGWKVSQWHLAG